MGWFGDVAEIWAVVEPPAGEATEERQLHYELHRHPWGHFSLCKLPFKPVKAYLAGDLRNTA